MTHLYLIRHGEATTQIQPLLRDEGLTPLGVAQAERLRDRLAATGEIQADVLIASTLPRARQTAEIIAPSLGLPITYDDEVQEMRLGEADGMHIDEVRKKYGGFNLDREPFQALAPGAENWPQFMLRVSTSLDRIVHEYEGKTIVVVCHGGVIDGSFVYFFNMGSLRLPYAHFNTQNTSITSWRKIVSDERPTFWRLIRYNDDFHVRDLDAASPIPWKDLATSSQREPPVQEPATPPSEK